MGICTMGKQLNQPESRSPLLHSPIARNHQQLDIQDIGTSHGPVRVIREGDPSLPVIITYPDIGLTYYNCFQGFIHQEDAWEIFKHFCFLHIHPPEHYEGAHNETIDRFLYLS